MAQSVKALYVVVLLYALIIASRGASASLCAYNFGARQQGRFVSSKINSNVQKIPKIYADIVNDKTHCIIFGRVTWNQDAIMSFSSSSSQNSGSVQVIMTVEGNSQVSQTRRSLRIGPSATQRFRGNTTRNFAIVYNKKSPTFGLTYLASWHRNSTCPNLGNEFEVVSCTTGNNIHSNCTFQCKEGFVPSPDLYNPNIVPESFRTFQSNLPQFSSVCSFSRRRRPAWKPDVLSRTNAGFGVEWKEHPHYWKCISMDELRRICLKGIPVTLSYKGLFKNHLYSHYGRNNCYYPSEYLLSIFNETMTQTTTTTTAAPATTTTTTTTAALTTTKTTKTPASTTTQTNTRIIPTRQVCQIFCLRNPLTGSNKLPPCRRIKIKRFRKVCSMCRIRFCYRITSFSFLLGGGGPGTTRPPKPDPCNQHCQLSPFTKSYYPRCGSHLTFDKMLDCLTCRYDGDKCNRGKILEG